MTFNQTTEDIAAELIQARNAIDACIAELRLPSDWLRQVESGTFDPPPSYDGEDPRAPPSYDLITQMQAIQLLLRARAAQSSHVAGGSNNTLPSEGNGGILADNTSGLQRGLHRLQRRTGSLLPEMELRAGEVRRIGTQPVAGATKRIDIWEGEYLGKEKVAIKLIRGVSNNAETMKRFKQEVEVWRKLWDHDRGAHILPFYGWCQTDGPHPYLVSPWQYRGTALDYVRTHRDVNYKNLIVGIAEGVAVLHTALYPPVVHGNLRAENIFIDAMGKPLIADFGVAQLANGLTGTAPMSDECVVWESCRWQAPEVVCENEQIITTFSDIWSLGMTILELMSHRRPFDDSIKDHTVIMQLSNGARPNRPEDIESRKRGFDEALWTLLSRGCWDSLPQRRLRAEQVVSQLQEWRDRSG